ncbi:phosphate ABC transporter ATP-binding protein [bacterium]|nr:phosphate ABC transporter ATP-binding protein [bacterium]
MNESRTTLDVTHLSRTIQTNGKQKTIVNDVSFSFTCGTIYSIVGPSGAGKSSLLRLINRLDEPNTGDVIFNGADYRTYSPNELRRHIGYLFQTPYMFPGTIAENVRYAAEDIDDNRVAELLEQVGLSSDMADSEVDNLSGGEKQRVALARLLATKPSVILLDEPTSSLDPTATKGIEKLVRRIAEDRCLIVIMVTHDPQQALRLEGETLLLVKGRLIEHGSSERVINDPQSDEGRRYKDRELT